MLAAAVISGLLAVGVASMDNDVTAEHERAYEALVRLGVELNDPFELDDVVGYEDPTVRWAIERGFLIIEETPPPAGQGASQKVASDLIWTMGREWFPADIMGMDIAEQLARDPVYFSDDVVVIDFERINQAGDYVALLQEMTRLGDGLVVVANARDSFPAIEVMDTGGGQASLEFEYGGAAERWDLQLDYDWVDPRFFVWFDELVERADPAQALYSFNDGQSDLFFIASQSRTAELARLTGEPVRDWRGYRGETR